MNNQEYILKSEVRKIIERKIDEYDSLYSDTAWDGYKSTEEAFIKLLSELDNLSGVIDKPLILALPSEEFIEFKKNLPPHP